MAIQLKANISKGEIIPAKTDVGALGNRINKETRSLHDQINKLMTLKFAIAVRNPKVYRQGIQMFYHIFSAIEDCLEREMNRDTKYTEMFRNIYKPELLRRAKLYKDLMFFYDGHSENFEKPILTKQIEFCDYIRKTTFEHPYLLLAYMHVLYLALFAGGRILSSQIAKSLRLFPQVEGKSFEEIVEEGTNFYKFDVPNTEDFRVLYKRDYELQTRNFLSEEEKEEVINETKYIYKTLGESVKEIETHNLQKIKGSVAYHVFTKGYYVAMALLVLLTYFIAKQLLLRLIY